MKNRISILIIAMLACAGCTEKIDLKLDSSFTRIVVEGDFNSEYKYQTIKLTKTSSYFYNEVPPPLSNATVTIDNGDSTFVLNEFPEGSGIYQTTIKAKAIPGKKYNLHISDVSIDGAAAAYEATSAVSHALTLDSVTAQPPSDEEFSQYKLDPNKTWYIIKIWGQEPSTPGGCYQWDYYINGVLKTDTIYESVYLDDQLINGSYFQGKTIFIVNANPGDTITLATLSITREYLDFVIALLTESSGGVSPLSGGPLSNGPPANVQGNVTNGALGFFRTSSVTYNVVILK